MKPLYKMSAMINVEAIQKNIEKAVEETAQDIWADTVNEANYRTGNFITSITIDPVKTENNTVSTVIGSDLMVTSKAGNSYNLGYLLEHGTNPHDIPNAFGYGEWFGIGGRFDGKFHPGTQPYLFYHKAGVKNYENFKARIREAVKGGLK